MECFLTIDYDLKSIQHKTIIRIDIFLHWRLTYNLLKAIIIKFVVNPNSDGMLPDNRLSSKTNSAQNSY